MNSTNQKLRSSRGATMIYALAALLIITVVSFLVISSATVNVGRVQKSQTEQQAYLTVSSAASLVQKSLDGEEVEVEVVTVSQDGATGTPTVPARKQNDASQPNPSSKNAEEGIDAVSGALTGKTYNAFSPLLKEWVKAVAEPGNSTIANMITNGTVPTAEFLLEETIGTGADAKEAKLRVTLTMDLPDDLTNPKNGFDLHAKIEEVKESTDASGTVTYEALNDYTMAMDFKAKVKCRTITDYSYELQNEGTASEKEVEVITEIAKTTVTWTAGNIRKGAAE